MLTPYKSISPSAEGDQGAALDRSPDGAMPLRVLRTWAAPNMGYAQPFEKGGPKLFPLCYAVVIVGPAWSLNGVLSEAQNRPHATWQWVISTSRPLLLPTPGTT